jgi:hypothetical protein
VDDDTQKIDHDRLFKELITTFFVEFVEAFLPEVALYLDASSLDFLDKEVFTDVTEGKKYESDIVVRAKFRGEDVFFLLLIENQSKSSSDFPKRMFTYFARFHEKFDLPVYPVAVLSYDEPYKEATDRYDIVFPDRDVLRFQYRTVQLNRLDWRDYLKIPNPAATALMIKMRIAQEDRLRVRVECLRLIVTLKLDPARTRLIAGFMGVYLRLNAAEFDRFMAEVERSDASEVIKQEMITLTNEWIEAGMEAGMKKGLEQGLERGVEQGIAQGVEQGIEQGIAQGVEQGIAQGVRRTVLRLLAHKFGESVATDIEPKLAALDAERCEALAEELFELNSKEAVQEWLKLSGPA